MIDTLDYKSLIIQSLKHVVKQALLYAAKHGLDNDHIFYITFRTNAPGVDVPDYLREQYPDELTIILQYQFWDLEVYDKAFSVRLSFNNKQEKIFVPFDALLEFADTAVDFVLQFDSFMDADDFESIENNPTDPTDPSEPDHDPTTPGNDSKVIHLDSFRKQ